MPAGHANYRSNNGGTMNVKPANRNILISIPEEKTEDTEPSAFLLPEEFKRKTIERYTVVKIEGIAEDCQRTHQYHIGTRCVVETSMINEINVDSRTYNIVAENYIVLYLEE